MLPKITAIGLVLLFAGCQRTEPPARVTVAPATVETPQTVTALSQKASQLKNGMTYKQAVTVLGRSPDVTRLDGSGLRVFEWQNDTLACAPVSIQVSAAKTVAGWDEGRTCGSEPRSLNEAYGDSCKNNPACKP